MAKDLKINVQKGLPTDKVRSLIEIKLPKPTAKTTKAKEESVKQTIKTEEKPHKNGADKPLDFRAEIQAAVDAALSPVVEKIDRLLAAIDDSGAEEVVEPTPAPKSAKRAAPVVEEEDDEETEEEESEDIDGDEVLLSVDEIEAMNLEDLQKTAKALGLDGMDSVKSPRIIRNKLLEAMKAGQLVESVEPKIPEGVREKEEESKKYRKMMKEFKGVGFYDGSCKVQCHECPFKDKCYDNFFKDKFYANGSWDETWPTGKGGEDDALSIVDFWKGVETKKQSVQKVKAGYKQ